LKITIPPVLSIDELSSRNDPIQQLQSLPVQIEGTAANYTRGKLHGTIVDPTHDGGKLLLVPSKSRVNDVPADIERIIGLDTAITL
jgi:hypothetical protein